MLKVVKTEVTQDEFVKEVEALFPGKFTEEGLRVLFDYIENLWVPEYEISKIGEDFEEWTFEKYQDYLIERFGKTSDKQENWDLPTKNSVERFLYEEVHEDDLSDSVAGFTDSTIMFTTHYISHLVYELKKMYKRMRTISLEDFCKEFDCTPDTIEGVFERYTNGKFMDFDKLNNKVTQVFHLVFRGRTDTEITFEQFEV